MPSPTLRAKPSTYTWTVNTLLLDPAATSGVRDLARRTGLPVSTTSKALAPIREAALLDNGQALTPDLFWALADVWKPVRIPLAARPPEGTGKLSGTVAAAELGAPIAVVADSPPDLYVSDIIELRALERRFGTTSGQSRHASVAVQPTPLVMDTATDSVAHPLFVALDLTQDRARGREILDAWNPRCGVSGEPVVLAAGSAPLVAAAGHATRNAGVRAVVIGGLGVICRLQRPHRATGDVDTATDGYDSISLVARIPGAILVSTSPLQPDSSRRKPTRSKTATSHASAHRTPPTSSGSSTTDTTRSLPRSASRRTASAPWSLGRSVRRWSTTPLTEPATSSRTVRPTGPCRPTRSRRVLVRSATSSDDSTGLRLTPWSPGCR